MSFRLVLATLSLCGFVLFSASHAKAACNPVPGNNVTCATLACDTLGMTSMDGKRDGLVACVRALPDNIGNCLDGGCTWKAMGGGGSVGKSYTAFGTTSCAAGWTVAYTGAASAPYVTTGDVGATVCVAGAATGSGSIGWFYGAINAWTAPSCAVCVQ
jgi:hypothetical protein